MPTALITGAAGQDGVHLARYLRGLGYEVVGMVQFGSEHERQLVTENVGDIELVTGDMTDLASLLTILLRVKPNEVYNLAGISSVAVAWEQPARSTEVNGLGLVNLLEAVRASGDRLGEVRIFQASSAQMFGDVDGEWFSETTPIRPKNPYGAGKAAAHFVADAYRSRYGMFVSCGILGNHDSVLHDADFAVPRITRAVSRIATGDQDQLVLENLTATRDWGYAGDYVVAMHAALQHDRPEDFVIATGELHSVAELVELAFDAVGIPDWQRYVSTTGSVNGRAHRGVRGDISKARSILGWAPKVGFKEMIGMMVDHQLRQVRRLADPPGLRHASPA